MNKMLWDGHLARQQARRMLWDGHLARQQARSLFHYQTIN
jgi:hypothetical protein